MEGETVSERDRAGRIIPEINEAAAALKAASDAAKAKIDQIDVGQINAVVGQALEIVTTINGFLAFLSKFIPKGK